MTTATLTGIPFKPRAPYASDAEWRTRVELAAAYRALALAGITDLTYNHLSARVPDQPDQFLIKSEHLFFNEVTASSLHLIIIDDAAAEAAASEHEALGYPDANQRDWQATLRLLDDEAPAYRT